MTVLGGELMTPNRRQDGTDHMPRALRLLGGLQSGAEPGADSAEEQPRADRPSTGSAMAVSISSEGSEPQRA
jgi:hypothetical protein